MSKSGLMGAACFLVFVLTSTKYQKANTVVRCDGADIGQIALDSEIGANSVKPQVPSRGRNSACVPTYGDPVYKADFENGLRKVLSMGGCYEYSFAIVPNPAGVGNVLRVINKGAEDNRNCSNNYGRYFEYKSFTGYKHRAELKHGYEGPFNTLQLKPGTQYRISERIFVPHDFPLDAPRCIIVTQIENPGGSSFGPELVTLICQGGLIRISQTVRSADGNLIRKDETIYEGKFGSGKWMELVFNLVRSDNDSGMLQVSIDGRMVLDQRGPNINNHAVSPFLKTGIYWGTRPRDADYTLYFDDVMVWQGSWSGLQSEAHLLGTRGQTEVPLIFRTPGQGDNAPEEVSNAKAQALHERIQTRSHPPVEQGGSAGG